jgi:hypothetical protein
LHNPRPLLNPVTGDSIKWLISICMMFVEDPSESHPCASWYHKYEVFISSIILIHEFNVDHSPQRPFSVLISGELRVGQKHQNTQKKNSLRHLYFG